MSNVGETIIVEEGKIYLSMYITEDGLVFECVDGLNYGTQEAGFLASVARGLVEVGLTRLAEVIEAGTNAFIGEGVMVRKDELVTTEDGTDVVVPKDRVIN